MRRLCCSSTPELLFSVQFKTIVFVLLLLHFNEHNLYTTNDATEIIIQWKIISLKLEI